MDDGDGVSFVDLVSVGMLFCKRKCQCGGGAATGSVCGQHISPSGFSLRTLNQCGRIR